MTFFESLSFEMVDSGRNSLYSFKNPQLKKLSDTTNSSLKIVRVENILTVWFLFEELA